MNAKTFSVFLVLSAALGASSCSRVTSRFSLLNGDGSSRPAAGIDQAQTNPQEEVPLSSEGTVAIRNFGQISQSMAKVTGIPADDATASAYYRDQRTRFSLRGDAASVTASMIMANTSLAGIYCSKLVSKDAAIPAGSAQTRLVHPSVNFQGDATPASLTPAIKDDVVRRYFNQFLRRDPKPEEQKIVTDAMAAAAAEGAGLSSANNLKAVLIVGCTSVLGSAEFLQL